MTNFNDIIYEYVARNAALQVHAAIITDMHTGEIVFCTELANQIFGYEHGELVGQKVEVLVPEAVREKHMAYREEFAKAPRARPMGHGLVLLGRRKNGDRFPVQVSLSDIDASSSLKRQVVCAFIIDLTEPVKTATHISKMVKEGEAVMVEEEGGT